MRCWAESQEGLVLLQHGQRPARQGGGAIPTTPRSPPTLCFIHLGHEAFWESTVCVRPKAARSMKQLHCHIGFLGISEVSTRIYGLRQQHSPLLHFHSCMANTTQNISSTSPDPKVPPSCTNPPGAGSGKKGSAAVPGRSTNSDVFK